jgi:hypothetical protein
MVCFKLRDGELGMTVMNRSNDAIWGAYGANAVQFSMLHEFVALACGAQMMGKYRQISDSFHVYTNQATWLKCRGAMNMPDMFNDPYLAHNLRPYPLMEPGYVWQEWLAQNHLFLRDELAKWPLQIAPFFYDVAVPMLAAWRAYKKEELPKKERVAEAIEILMSTCKAEDWSLAGIRWLRRRGEG